MTSTPTNNMLLLPPSAFQSTSSIHSNNDKENQTTVQQLEQLQLEMGRLRTNNEAQKTSGRGNRKGQNFFCIILKKTF
jgi:hypothetical protein